MMCENKETGYGQYNSGNYCNPEVDELVTLPPSPRPTWKNGLKFSRS
jgi:hypothetical protein